MSIKHSAAALVVIGMMIASDYDRGTWKHWSDLDGDGRNTRTEILERDRIKCKNGAECVPAWYGKYNAEIELNSSKVHIDHVYAIKEAWANCGGKWWGRNQKEQFANDHGNLLAVTARANISKGARNESQWMPKDAAAHCWYVLKRIEIRKKYNCVLTMPEFDTIIKHRECFEWTPNKPRKSKKLPSKN